jgi:hypothetical protein
MELKNIYERNISFKEAENGFIFILKNKLNFFPPLGIDFKITENGSARVVKVKSYSCTCRGPKLPHEHYYIHWAGLKKNDAVKIIKNGDIYQIEIN